MSSSAQSRFPHGGPVAAARVEPIAVAELEAAGLVRCPICDMPARPQPDGTVGDHGCSPPIRYVGRAAAWGTPRT